MVAINMCRKSPITRGVDGITWKRISFHVFRLLFICLFNDILHFYICNVWFIVANFILFYFIFLSFILELFLFLSLLFKVYNNIFTCKYVQIL